MPNRSELQKSRRLHTKAWANNFALPGFRWWWICHRDPQYANMPQIPNMPMYHRSPNMPHIPNMPQIPNIVKAWAAGPSYMRVEGESCIKYNSSISNRFCCWLSFNTKKLNWKPWEVFASLPFILEKEEFCFVWVLFQLVHENSRLDSGQT